MAIAFEFDFRSNQAGTADDAGKRAFPGKEHGQEFAAILSRARTGETGDEAAPAPLIGPANFLAPLIPDAEAGAIAAIEVPVAAGEEIAEAPIPGELELDREINLIRAAEAQLGRPSDTAAAPASRLHAAVQAAPETIEQAPEVSVETAGEAAASQAAVPPPAAEGQPDTVPQATPSPIAAPQQAPQTAQTTTIEASAVLATAPVPASSRPAPVEQRVEAPAAAQAGAAAKAPDQPAADMDLAEDVRPDRFVTAVPAHGDKPAHTDTASTLQQAAQPVSQAAAVPAPVPAAQMAPVPATMTTAHALVVASPAQIVDIVSKSASDGQSDRVIVQLDPPELGRVSIDFKFDSQGLQHVTITSETPEAMRQLRAMHFELLQALERQGLDGQNMTFQHQQQHSQQAANADLLKQLQAGPAAAILTGAPAAAGVIAAGPITADGRLDIRL